MPPFWPQQLQQESRSLESPRVLDLYSTISAGKGERESLLLLSPCDLLGPQGSFKASSQYSQGSEFSVGKEILVGRTHSFVSEPAP